MFHPIYEPRTRAREYCDLAVNIYDSCPHGCTYCYARAMGFPDSYIIEHGADGKPTSKTEQVRLIGNAVCPDVAAALVAANYVESRVEEVFSAAGVAASM